MKTYRVLTPYVDDRGETRGAGATLTLPGDPPDELKDGLQLIADSDNPEIAYVVQCTEREIELGKDAATQPNAISAEKLAELRAKYGIPEPSDSAVKGKR